MTLNVPVSALCCLISDRIYCVALAHVPSVAGDVQLIPFVDSCFGGCLKECGIISGVAFPSGLNELILADTKLEFGFADDGTVCLGDEALTCDSSRFLFQMPGDRENRLMLRLLPAHGRVPASDAEPAALTVQPSHSSAIRAASVSSSGPAFVMQRSASGSMSVSA
jgi:hypothetical protein